MSGRRDDSLVLDDILDAVERLLLLRRSSGAVLGSERSVNDQVLWNLIVIGEATKRLSEAIRKRFPEIPWANMAETRDRIVHNYEGVDWAVVALILDSDLPPLRPGLREIRDELRREADTSS